MVIDVVVSTIFRSLCVCVSICACTNLDTRWNNDTVLCVRMSPPFLPVPLKRVSDSLSFCCLSMVTYTEHTGCHARKRDPHTKITIIYTSRVQMSNRKLFFGTAITAAFCFGFGVPVFAVHFQQQKTKGGGD